MSYFDRNGQPMTLMEWAAAFEEEERHIGDDTVGLQRISTVWLGSDHQFGDGPPLIFETMIFGGEHDRYCERYSTQQEAREGHQRILQSLKDGIHPVASA